MTNKYIIPIIFGIIFLSMVIASNYGSGDYNHGSGDYGSGDYGSGDYGSGDYGSNDYIPDESNETEDNETEENETIVETIVNQETSESSNGGSTNIEGWSTRCGYNKECLYGKTNETEINETIIETKDIDPIKEKEIKPIIEEEGKGGIITGIVLLIIGIILTFLITKIPKKESEEIDYVPEDIEENNIKEDLE